MRTYGHFIAACLIFSTLISPTTWAKPTTQELKPLEPTLSKVIKLEARSISATEALAKLQYASGLPIVIDTKSVPDDGEYSFLFTAVTAKSALDWIVELADLEYEYRRGAIFVASQAALDSKKIITKSYDVRALIRYTLQFPGPDLRNNDEDGGYVHFCDSPEEEMLDGNSIIELIQHNIDRESWDKKYAAISIQAGRIFITQSPRMHERIKDFLSDMMTSESRQVSHEFISMAVAADDIHDFKAAHGIKGNVLTPKQTSAMQTWLKANPKKWRRLSKGSNISGNGQRVYVSATEDITHLSNMELESKGVWHNTEKATSGFKADVHPFLGPFGKYITLVLRIDDADVMNLRSKDYEGEIKVKRDDQIVSNEDKENKEPAKTTFERSDTHARTQGQIEMPKLEFSGIRSTVRIPSGGSVLLSASSSRLNKLSNGELDYVIFFTAVEDSI